MVNNMKTIPASNWVLDRVYFKVKLVDNFGTLYKEWFIKENGSIDGSVDGFVFRVQENTTIEVYQFPSQKPWDNDDNDQDYFERLDDNHVIPRQLFELV